MFHVSTKATSSSGARGRHLQQDMTVERIPQGMLYRKIGLPGLATDESALLSAAPPAPGAEGGPATSRTQAAVIYCCLIATSNGHEADDVLISGAAAYQDMRPAPKPAVGAIQGSGIRTAIEMWAGQSQ